jgi:hypothetical protein
MIKVNKNLVLTLLCVTMFLFTVFNLIYIYAGNSVEYSLDEVEIECLFTSEADVVTEYDITAETEDINIDNIVGNEDVTDKVVEDSVKSISNIEIYEYQEEIVVNDKLSSRVLDTDVGSSEETLDEKYYRIFGDNSPSQTGHVCYFSSDREARNHMVGFYITVWSIDENEEWYQREVYLESHKNLEKTFKCLFAELLELPEEDRIPIKLIGAYNFRDGYSQHTAGVAIDINWEENAEMTNSGIITAGYFWKPYENIYSIPPDSEMVKIFKKYGFGWGGEWTSKKDYMHFSYLER